MNKRQENKFTMYEGISTLFRTNTEMVNSVPVLKDSAGEFDTTLVAIRTKSEEVSNASTGKTAVKGKAEDALITILLPVAAGLFVYAKKQNNIDVIEKYERCPLLIIDDIGSEKVSDWSRQMFYLLIDRRYRNVQPTIITSNLSLQQIAENIDERISSRICEMGSIAELTGKDRRVEK